MAKKIRFAKKAQLAQALAAGRVLRTEGGVRVYFDEDRSPPFVAETPGVGTIRMGRVWAYPDWYEEEWFDDIPRLGGLCMVSDQRDDSATMELIEPKLRLVVQYTSGVALPFIDTCGDAWRYAEPATAAQVNKYILPEE